MSSDNHGQINNFLVKRAQPLMRELVAFEKPTRIPLSPEDAAIEDSDDELKDELNFSVTTVQ
jgi:hypothetical protein